MVRIPPHVVEDAVRAAPRPGRALRPRPRQRLRARARPRRPSPTSARASASSTRDRRVSASRPRPTSRDIARLIDACPTSTRYESAVGASDVPPETCAAAQRRGAVLQHHQAGRHRAAVALPRRRHLRAWRRSSSAAPTSCARRPILYIGVCPVSPLKLPRDATEVIIETARWGMPDNILSMAMAGGSSPVTLAGTLVTHNAEVLGRHHAGTAHRARPPGHLRLARRRPWT